MFTLRRSSDVQLQLIDAQGKQVETLVDERLEAGTHVVGMNAAPKRAGLYTIRLVVNRQSTNKRVVIVH